MTGNEVRVYDGVPPVGAFAGTRGTPIIIDTNTATAYFLGPGNVVTPFATGPASSMIVTRQTASFGLTAADVDDNHWFEMDVAAPCVMTVPSDSTATIAPGKTVLWSQYGAGQITFAPGIGVNIRNASSLTSRAQYSCGGLTKVAADEWMLYGDTT